MKLKLAYYGNPVLRKKAVPITEITNEIKMLAADMEEVMNEKDGIGIAAPQVNVSLAIFLTRVPYLKEGKKDENNEENWEKGEVRVFINPKILNYSEWVDSFSEGCLSIPKLYGDVTRPTSIKVEATDLTGNRFTEDFSGLHARVIMHENDHLNGVLFIDRLDPKEKKLLEPKLREIKKNFN
ncbi:MAG TPA: peptide deformylase [Parachlamydiaceae bacterium]|nr:peptide deformylase [Parachlamydiaceae bacterium]